MRLVPRAAAAVAAGCLLSLSAAQAQVIWNQPAGGSWNVGTNWSTGTVPNGTDVSVAFHDAAGPSNPAQSGNRTVTTDAAITVGSITFNNDAANAFTNSLTTGASGSLTFQVTSGSATINVPTFGASSGTGNNTISAPMHLTSSLVANVDLQNVASAAGALNLTATIDGAGGFTKNGDGLATFGTGAKTYTGPTVVNGGRMRISAAASPSGTSSFTVSAGGELTFTGAAGTVNLGTGSLFLNGNGPTTGQFANGGAIRPDRTNNPADYAIPNNVVLQTNSVIHSQAQGGSQVAGNPIDSITLSGVVSGPGRLQFTANGSDIDQGTLNLTNANTYTGGTLVAGGIVRVTGGTAAAPGLGTGTVTVDNSVSPASIARLSIPNAGINAIADNATLVLAGGGTPNTADQNFAILGAGVNEMVGGLILGGVTQTQAGTYGATGSGA
ncbi:MAG TPA: autotransporter-associated beta strand repeat-containing protein, partial [Gemmataceae bacterium]